jgi:hypothetical protein
MHWKDRLSDRRCAAAVLMSLRVPGQGTDKYDNVRIGMNARLDIIQAAVPSLPKSVNQIRSPTTAADYSHARRAASRPPKVRTSGPN